MGEDFKGPVSILVGFEDVIAPAKALADFAKSGATKSPEIICGVVEGKKVSSEEVQALAKLPSREELISQMLSVFQGPTTNFAGVFSSLLRKLVGTLDAIREKKETVELFFPLTLCIRGRRTFFGNLFKICLSLFRNFFIERRS